MTTAAFRKTDFLPQENRARKANIVIAVDGPAASGKGTLAKKLAERLGYAYLDTGALYRAVGFATLEMGGDPSNFRDVAPALEVVKKNLTPELLGSAALRAPAVSDAASKVGAIAQVRAALLEYQRAFAQNPPGETGGAVLDGRDIGTVVCPEADIKLFVTASTEERAKRRSLELKTVSCDTVLADMKARDARDEERAVAPTRAAEDAYVIDTTALSAPQVVEEAIGVIRAKFIELTGDAAV